MLSTAPTGRTPLRRHGSLSSRARPLLVGLFGGLILLGAVAGPISAAEGDPSPTPTPSVEPTPTPDPTPPPDPTPIPDPTPPPSVVPAHLDLYVSSGFRYQDPNPSACTSTSAMIMLNFILAKGTGGDGFRWARSLSNTKRDSVLRWERSHDTLTTGTGSDPHGWRNALNYYGWGAAALTSAGRVYDDVSFPSYGSAMKGAVRAMIATGKPVGVLGWKGHHAQVITGYYGLVGDPFEKNADGRFTETFKIGGLYFSDVLRSDRMRHSRISYYSLQHTTNYRIRFRVFMENDSLRDDSYTSGWRRSREEWYRRYVLVLPLR